jgi:hypothetical protein
VALPVKVPQPVFWTVKVRFFVDPTGTNPKLRLFGITLNAGTLARYTPFAVAVWPLRIITSGEDGVVQPTTSLNSTLYGPAGILVSVEPQRNFPQYMLAGRESVPAVQRQAVWTPSFLCWSLRFQRSWQLPEDFRVVFKRTIEARCRGSAKVPARGAGLAEADLRKPEPPGYQMDHLPLDLHDAGHSQKGGGPH